MTPEERERAFALWWANEGRYIRDWDRYEREEDAARRGFMAALEAAHLGLAA